MVLADMSAAAVLQAVEPLLVDATARREMGANAARLCDGMGAARVAGELLGQFQKVSLRPAVSRDMDIVYGWQSAPGARQFARSPEIPSLDEHQAWFRTRLTRSDKDPFYIVETEGVPSGFVRLDTTDRAQGWEVSVLVSQAMQGQGLARTALGLLRLSHPKESILAEVHPDNSASQNLFARAGYQRMDESHFVSRGWIEIIKGQDHED